MARTPKESPGATRLSDIAKSLGIATSTVSMAIAGDPRIAEATRKTVQQRAKELGFRPNPHAQRLLKGFTKGAVALVMHDIDQGALTSTISDIRVLLSQRDLRPTIHIAGNKVGDEQPHLEADALRTLRHERPEAIVCFGAGVGDDAIAELRRYQEEGGTLVSYFSPLPLPCDQINFDEEHNSRLAVDHLVSLGHRRIGFVAHGNFDPNGARVKGFVAAMKDQGLAIDPTFLLSGGQYEDGGRDLAHRYLAFRHRPTALCIVNDAQASGFIAEMYRLGFLVPQYVSVVGTDDVAVARNNWIPITTTSMPTRLIASKVAETVLGRLSRSLVAEPKVENVLGELIVRATTRPPRPGADEA